jgi:MoxR-like ATPase
LTQSEQAVSALDREKIEKLGDTARKIRGELDKKIVGMRDVIDKLLMALFAGGHCLLVRVPGLAKTLLISSLSEILSLKFRRIQFTPDLMPSDITGTEIIAQNADTGERLFQFAPGPIFAHLVLADEINRTPPKTQAALLEAMEERQVSADGVTRPLPEPFLVCATQNPIEHEGTYTLPEAQLDRFLIKLLIDVPPRESEVAVLRRHADGFSPRELEGVAAVVSPDEIRAAQRSAAAVTVTDDVLGYVVDLPRRHAQHAALHERLEAVLLRHHEVHAHEVGPERDDHL